MVGGGQIWAVQDMPGLTQRLQDELQQTVPASHTVFPHFPSLMGTHWAFPSICKQAVPAAHRTDAQVIAFPEPRSTGLP